MPPQTSKSDPLQHIFETLNNRGFRIKLTQFEGVVFHGTGLTIARKILKSGSFRDTAMKKGRYGQGVYFYESDLEDGVKAALLWASEKAKKPEERSKMTPPAVIKANIRVKRMFDMTTRDNQDYVRRLESLLRDFALKERAYELLERLSEQFIGFLIGQFSPMKDEIQAIRGVYKIPTFAHRNQKGLVLRDQSCIVNLTILPLPPS